MKIIINQFRGLGDILFIVPIARHYISKGYSVVWPVEEIYADIGKHFPDIEFINKNHLKIDYDRRDFYYHKDALVIPMRFSDSLMNVPYYLCMASKYMLVNLPRETWRTLTWTRDSEAEVRLRTTLNIKDGERYNLVNNNFLTSFKGQSNINPDNGLRNIYMSLIPGYTLLDWGKVIEQAENIFTVGTSINYMLEVMELHAKEIHLYPRIPHEYDFKNYDYLFVKPYTFH
jgi:hypothetical protein